MRLGYELGYANLLTKASDQKNPDTSVRVAVSPLERLYIRVFGLPETTKQQQARRVFRSLKDIGFGTPRIANSLLDIGCAQGQYTIRVARNYPQACVRGIDFDAEKISIANEVRRIFGLSNLSFEVGDISEVRNREEYDVVLFLQIIEHLPDETVAFKSVRDKLRKGGMLIITGPSKGSKVNAW
jgi:2-polyprenyl-3-methyl-5-hydroxy-6-metoxy-1,4-benzoquinol methylase